MNVSILRCLAENPKQQIELRRECGLPAQTTLRALLKRLVDIGAVEKHRRDRFPGVLEYELPATGRDLLFVAQALERWLSKAPDGPLSLGDNAAKAAIKALAEGWSTTMLRALAAGPLSLTELDRVITAHSYPSLERRLSALRLAGLTEARRGNRRGTPYAVSDWLRQGAGPLATAARWERRHLPATTAAITPLDVETMFLLTVPMLRLPPGTSGTCCMAAEIPDGTKPRLAGVIAEVQDERVTSCSTNFHGQPDAWALGPAAAWLSAMVEGDVDRLELGGDCGLARALLSALYESLFGLGPVRVENEGLDLNNSIRDDGLN